MKIIIYIVFVILFSVYNVYSQRSSSMDYVLIDNTSDTLYFGISDETDIYSIFGKGKLKTEYTSCGAKTFLKTLIYSSEIGIEVILRNWNGCNKKNQIKNENVYFNEIILDNKYNFSVDGGIRNGLTEEQLLNMFQNILKPFYGNIPEEEKMYSMEKDNKFYYFYLKVNQSGLYVLDRTHIITKYGNI